jgi:hypothetical protein
VNTTKVMDWHSKIGGTSLASNRDDEVLDWVKECGDIRMLVLNWRVLFCFLLKRIGNYVLYMCISFLGYDLIKLNFIRWLAPWFFWGIALRVGGTLCNFSSVFVLRSPLPLSSI